MQGNPNEREIARPDSWKTLKMPKAVAVLSLDKTFTATEFGVMARGFVPEVMEDKWFVFMHNDELFFHRSWTGICIYKVVFEQQGDEYRVRQALANRDPKQCSRRDPQDDETDIGMLNWLMDAFLLRKPVPLPKPPQF